MSSYLELQDCEDLEELEPAEYERLTDWPPLMRLALEYLAQQQIGLAPPGHQLPRTLRETILLVDQEIKLQSERKRKERQEIEEGTAWAQAWARKYGGGEAP